LQLVSAVCFEKYLQVILRKFLQSKQKKQDSATARMSMQALSDVFGDRIISSGVWPACSPDLNPCDFFLLGLFEGKSLQQ
jgi:hypothetical protein